MIRALVFLAAVLVPAAALAHTADEAMRLGEKLMAREEWYRAASVFEEAALESTGATAQAAWLRAADAHRMARQYEPAAALYREAASAATEQADLATLREGQSLYLAKKFEPATARLAVVVTQYPDSKYRNEAEAYLALAHLAVGDWGSATGAYRHLADRATDTTTKKAWSDLASASAGISNTPEKSLRLAAFLSLILPGAGQIYTEHYGEAAMAFAVNAVFGALFWDSWLKARDLQESGPHRGWAYTTPTIYGFLGSSFYLGNIYGAAISAQRYNRLEVDKAREQVKDRTIKIRLFELPIQ